MSTLLYAKKLVDIQLVLENGQYTLGELLDKINYHAHNGNLIKVQLLLEYSPDFSYHCAALSKAFQGLYEGDDNMKLIRFLLTFDLDLSYHDYAIIHHAIVYLPDNEIDMFKQLYYAIPQCTMNNHSVLLRSALKYDKLSLAHILVENGANLDWKKDPELSEFINSKTLQFIRDHSINVDIDDRLFVVQRIKYNDYDFVKDHPYLLNHDDILRETIISAIRNNKKDIVIEIANNPDYRYIFDDKIFDAISIYKKIDIFVLLVELGIIPELETINKCFSQTISLFRHLQQNNVDVVSLIIS
jgi:hypothetical protein